jgi:hypothetical protein
MLGQIRLKIAGRKFHMEFKKKKKSWKSVEPYKICWHTSGREFNKENKYKQLNRLKNKHTHAKTVGPLVSVVHFRLEEKINFNCRGLSNENS